MSNPLTDLRAHLAGLQKVLDAPNPSTNHLARHLIGVGIALAAYAKTLAAQGRDAVKAS